LLLVLGTIASCLDWLCGYGAALLVGDSLTSQFTVFAGLLVAHTILTSIVTLPGPCLAALALTILYRNLHRDGDSNWEAAWNATALTAEGSRRSSRLLLTALPVGIIAVEIIVAVTALRDLYQDRPVVVTAHRGGTMRSIENTLEAIGEAIDDGAQYAEIDVQMSSDGVLVVTHDSDFSRLAGIATKVWELTSTEIAAITLRPPVRVDAPVSHAPTLDEVLDFARNKIRLNIELKYYGDHQPRLAERVVEAVRAKEMADRVIVQSLHYAGLQEVRRYAPEIPIGYLFSVNAREPKRLEVDFLSVQIGRVDAAFVKAAHRRKQDVHVWTVDKEADMVRMIDLGVDNVITNRPREALAIIAEQASLAPPEIALRRLRAWLRE
jgi:glycerophosphoryl diester phosphodiesterase